MLAVGIHAALCSMRPTTPRSVWPNLVCASASPGPNEMARSCGATASVKPPALAQTWLARSVLSCTDSGANSSAFLKQVMACRYDPCSREKSVPGRVWASRSCGDVERFAIVTSGLFVFALSGEQPP